MVNNGQHLHGNPTVTPTDLVHTYINNCKVDNTTISGTSDVDYIQGKNYDGEAGASRITECTHGDNVTLTTI